MKKVKNITNPYFFEYITIFNKSLDFNISKIILKDNNKYIERNLSFYILKMKKIGNFPNEKYETHIMEVNIKNLDINNIQIKEINKFEDYISLLVLSNNKNIIYSKFKMYLYDDLFNKEKLITSYRDWPFNIIKLNCNTIVYSMGYNLYILKIGENIINKNKIKNGGDNIIYYSEKKKILFTQKGNYINLINFNLVFPEIFQRIEILSNNQIFVKNPTKLIKFIGSFNDDSIFAETSQNIIIDNTFYNVFYIKQYKIIENELKEISSIELEKEKKSE